MLSVQPCAAFLFVEHREPWLLANADQNERLLVTLSESQLSASNETKTVKAKFQLTGSSLMLIVIYLVISFKYDSIMQPCSVLVASCAYLVAKGGNSGNSVLLFISVICILICPYFSFPAVTDSHRQNVRIFWSMAIQWRALDDTSRSWRLNETVGEASASPAGDR